MDSLRAYILPEEDKFVVYYKGKHYIWVATKKEIGESVVCHYCEYKNDGLSPQEFPWEYVEVKRKDRTYKWHIYHNYQGKAMIEIDGLEKHYVAEINPYYTKGQKEWVVDSDP